jgi:transposase
MYFSVPISVNVFFFFFFFCVVVILCDDLIDQRTNIKFLVKVGKSRQEILEMLETVYGESAMKCRTVYKWMDQFKEGRESVDDTAREGQPSTSRVGKNIQHAHNLVISDHRITTRIVTDKLGISKDSVQTILKEDLNVYDLNCRQKRIGSCITTMHPLTWRLLCVSFSPKTT